MQSALQRRPSLSPPPGRQIVRLIELLRRRDQLHGLDSDENSSAVVMEVTEAVVMMMLKELVWVIIVLVVVDCNDRGDSGNGS